MNVEKEKARAGPGWMTQGLRTLSVLAEDSAFIPSTHMVTHNQLLL